MARTGLSGLGKTVIAIGDLESKHREAELLIKESTNCGKYNLRFHIFMRNGTISWILSVLAKIQSILGIERRF